MADTIKAGAEALTDPFHSMEGGQPNGIAGFTRSITDEILRDV